MVRGHSPAGPAEARLTDGCAIAGDAQKMPEIAPKQPWIDRECAGNRDCEQLWKLAHEGLIWHAPKPIWHQAFEIPECSFLICL